MTIRNVGLAGFVGPPRSMSWLLSGQGNDEQASERPREGIIGSVASR